VTFETIDGSSFSDDLSARHGELVHGNKYCQINQLLNGVIQGHANANRIITVLD